MTDTDLMQDDLRDLLGALGLFSGARPQSPHEVVRECIERIEWLRADNARLVERLEEWWTWYDQVLLPAMQVRNVLPRDHRARRESEAG